MHVSQKNISFNTTFKFPYQKNTFLALVHVPNKLKKEH